MEAVLLIGIQGAGKTTFYRERFFRTHVRLSLDMLKTRRRLDVLLGACIEAKQPFVLDNTNVTIAERAHAIAPARRGTGRGGAHPAQRALRYAQAPGAALV